MSKQDKQDSLKKYYVTDLGIFLLNWIKVVGKIPLIKNYSFNDITSSKTIKKSYPLIGGSFLFILFFLMIFAVWKIPQIQVPTKLSTAERERITLEDKARSTLIQAIGGSALFITGCFAFLNYQISQKKLELDKETSEKNLELADSKQITERFSKAVEQLGNEESITVRLGAIYSLERIAKNSKDDHWTIMEVLTAFVREKSNDNRKPDAKIPQDIQAALTVIGRRNTENDPGNGRIDLSRLNLNGANFSKAKLDKTNFSSANLTQARFFESSLTEGCFVETNLAEAWFLEANLTEADFEKANLTEARFLEANLTEADFEKADLTEARFFRTNLTEADFEKANLTEANFEEVNLTKVWFVEANLTKVQFVKANLTEATFYSANLTKTEFFFTNLTIEQILEAENWDKAKYNSDFEEQLQPFLFFKFITEAIF